MATQSLTKFFKSYKSSCTTSNFIPWGMLFRAVTIQSLCDSSNDATRKRKLSDVITGFGKTTTKAKLVGLTQAVGYNAFNVFSWPLLVLSVAKRSAFSALDLFKNKGNSMKGGNAVVKSPWSLIVAKGLVQAIFFIPEVAAFALSKLSDVTVKAIASGYNKVRDCARRAATSMSTLGSAALKAITNGYRYAQHIASGCYKRIYSYARRAATSMSTLGSAALQAITTGYRRARRYIAEKIAAIRNNKSVTKMDNIRTGLKNNPVIVATVTAVGLAVGWKFLGPIFLAKFVLRGAAVKGTVATTALIAAKLGFGLSGAAIGAGLSSKASIKAAEARKERNAFRFDKMLGKLRQQRQEHQEAANTEGRDLGDTASLTI